MEALKSSLPDKIISVVFWAKGPQSHQNYCSSPEARQHHTEGDFRMTHSKVELQCLIDVYTFWEKKSPAVSIVTKLAQIPLFITIGKMLLGPPEEILSGRNDA